ncbi:STM3941 family protein [Mucilaginibacter gotjawali]|uniref:Uncharacterized protein n=2 Tax=Mucilaginibacter gotjawali TaxID=1550579 RepID=A0A839SH63_9SPHI|nr:STM3941 family protein [Mucilaginibacter gotjawali]MBB3055919.1 hypothetical protein [Mucilaginibacter gotjawali]BAU54743.1 hypothetical protein MgSA37_02921 [Mucilaginibacter gotjawali]
MEFDTRISSIFVMNMFFIGFAFVMAFYCSFYGDFRYAGFRYIYLIWLAIGFTRLLNYRKYFNFVIFRKPILVVNESGIYDLADNIKYLWKDIISIDEANAYLYIKVGNPKEYLANIQNPLKRFIKKLMSEPFKINVDMIRVNGDVLLDILDEYSNQALITSGNASIITNP